MKRLHFLNNLLSRLLWWGLVASSWLPFWVWHRISDFLFLVVFYGVRYRRKVVQENLRRSFPEKSDLERAMIERQFYKNFCDILAETIKTISISKQELQRRFRYQPNSFMQEYFEQGKNLAGVSSHLCNWEWVALCAAIELKHFLYGLFKPLSNEFLNRAMIQNRSRFGSVLLAVGDRGLYEKMIHQPYIVGIFADQAPHYYPKAIEVDFLNQKTFVVTGPAVMTVQKGMTPVWGWARRLGRSQYEWGFEKIDFGDTSGITDADTAQIERLMNAHSWTREQAHQALVLTRNFCKKLEERIRASPADWLWTHRRWKQR